MSPRPGERKSTGRDGTDATDEYPILGRGRTGARPAEDDDEAHRETHVLARSPLRADDDSADALASTGRFRRPPPAAPIRRAQRAGSTPRASAEPLESALEQLADMRMILANRDVQVRDLQAKLSAAERRLAELEGELRTERSHREALMNALEVRPPSGGSPGAGHEATHAPAAPDAGARRQRHWWFRLFVRD